MQAGEQSVEFELAELPHGEGLALRGRVRLADAQRLRDALARRLAEVGERRLDLSQLEALDAGAGAILADAWSGAERLELVGATGAVREVLELYTARGHAPPPTPPPPRVGMFDQVGRTSLGILAQLKLVLSYLGELSRAARTALRRPRSVRWRSVPALIERLGVDGVPIVCLIAFLVGLVTAFQGADQLHRFGADLLIADLVGLSVTRELAPLMTAIVVAGRCGASITAELGTMRVSEEVDALRTMGIGPHAFLVIPRILALVIVTPVLTLLADAAGLFAGLLIARFMLDIPMVGYLIALRDALVPWDVLSGLVKALFFGSAVGLIACERGLATRGGAAGVGRSTTSAVVTILFHLIVLDALLTILFQRWGI